MPNPPSAPRARRALLTGWFSFLHGEATAGDLAAGATASSWLDDAGIAHDTAWSPVLAAAYGGPTLDECDPARYTDLLFVCGPAAGTQVEQLCHRFAGCRRIAWGVSDPGGATALFDVVVARDGGGTARPDLSFVALRPAPWPLAVFVRANPQPEYGDRQRHDAVHAHLGEVLAGRRLAVVDADTRVDPRVPTQRDGAQLDGLLSAAAVAVTTRLHGLVLALRAGTPALAVDPVHGGAKVAAQAAAVGWPAVLRAEEVEGARVGELLDWCLTDEARHEARRSAERAATALGALHERFTAMLGDSGQ